MLTFVRFKHQSFWLAGPRFMKRPDGLMTFRIGKRTLLWWEPRRR